MTTLGNSASPSFRSSALGSHRVPGLALQTIQPIWPSARFEDTGTNERTSSYNATPFTSSKLSPNTMLLRSSLPQLTVTFLLPSRVARVSSSVYDLVEFFENLRVAAHKLHAAFFGHGTWVFGKEAE